MTAPIHQGIPAEHMGYEILERAPISRATTVVLARRPDKNGRPEWVVWDWSHYCGGFESGAYRRDSSEAYAVYAERCRKGY